MLLFGSNVVLNARRCCVICGSNMNDGGGESARELEQSDSIGDEDIVRAVVKIAVAQVCEVVGFQSFQASALETLTDVVVRYVRSVGKNAQLYENMSGRTESNVFDIVQGLEDLSGAQGFTAASDVHHCVADLGTVKEISQYVAEAEHVPFAYTIPRFPVVKDRKLKPTFCQSGEETPGEHIPNWLPVFPKPHTYSEPKTSIDKAAEPETALTEQEKQHRNVENFHRRLVCDEMEGPSVDHEDDENAKQARESNPYLATRLQFGETEVSQVTLPAKLSIEETDKSSAVLETFTPVIEAIKNKPFESEEDQQIITSRKQTVKFKIGMSMKSFGTVLHSGPHKKGFEEVYPWFGRENEKDEKKRRAERILKNSVENSHELAQL